MRKPQPNPSAKHSSQSTRTPCATRHAPTPSEAALWRLLSARKLGFAFRRQVPLASRYIADFYAPAARLVVEVDGARHCGRSQADARRDRVLARRGYRALHLEAGVVLEQPAVAVARIRAALAV